MSQKYKIVALVGEAGSGKDTIMKEILKRRPDWHEIISCTTRPPREGEKNGVNYYFYTDSEFLEMVVQGKMLEQTNFNNWFYGTPLSALDSDPAAINIGVFNPAGIKRLLENDNIDLDVFWIIVNEKERLIRQLTRENSPNVSEILRRYYADQEDFKSLPFDYWLCENNTQEDLNKAVQDIIECAAAGSWQPLD